MRVFVLILLLSAQAAGSSMEAIRRGLSAASRGARDAAERAARVLAQRDPAGVEGLWASLDGRGRRLLIRALASAGTEPAALVALKHASDPSPELFRALLSGLVAGGVDALFADLPKDLSGTRRRAIEALRLRWNVEKELVRLKSPAGSTGHYTGQFSGFLSLGRGVVPIFFDIVMNRSVPLIGEASSGPFQSIHPEMLHYDTRELRDLVAHGFGEITDKSDFATIAKLQVLFDRYWELPEKTFDFERNVLAAALAYSLYDLNQPAAAEKYIRELEGKADGFGYDALRAKWSLGYAHMRVGNHDKGLAYYQEILGMRGSGISRHLAAYNLACSFAMRARQEPKFRRHFKRLALNYLQEAVRLNWWDWGWIEADGDLDFIRDEPRYKSILQRLKEKWPDRRRGKHSKDPKDFLGGKEK